MAVKQSVAIFVMTCGGCASLLGADFDDQKAKPSALSPAAGGDEPTANDGDSGTTTPTPPTAPTIEAEAGAGVGKKKCSGVAQACRTLDSNSLCGGQRGCAWTAPKCTGLGTGCATFDPNVCSIRRPKCDFDFDTRECYPTQTWCSSATAATMCIDRDGCTWTGGCTGTETTCESLSIDQCAAQRGCAVVSS